MENNTVSVRTRSGEDLGAMTVADFLAKVRTEADTKAR
jgi:threonyl-tRNA synthetase